MAKECKHSFIKIHKGPYETVHHCVHCHKVLSEAEFLALKAKNKKEPEAKKKPKAKK